MVWVRACSSNVLRDGDLIALAINDRRLVLARAGSEVFALDDRCSHEDSPLADGWFEDGAIECPLHQARFCVRTGRRLSGPGCADVRAYPCREHGDDVEVDLGGEQG